MTDLVRGLRLGRFRFEDLLPPDAVAALRLGGDRRVVQIDRGRNALGVHRIDVALEVAGARFPVLEELEAHGARSVLWLLSSELGAEIVSEAGNG